MDIKTDFRLMERMLDIFVFVFLLGVFIIRIIGNDASWIGLLAYTSVLIALLDLFLEICRNFKNRRGISIIVIIGILTGIILSIILACLFTGVLTLSSMWIDLLTILALMISLPQKLYLFILDLILKKREE